MLLPRRGTRDRGARRPRRAEVAARALGGGATSASLPFLSPLLPPPARHRGERETPPPPLTGRAGRGSAASCQAAPAAARLTPPPCSGGTAHARQRHRGRGASPPAVPLPLATAGAAPLGAARPAGIPRHRHPLTAGSPNPRTARHPRLHLLMAAIPATPRHPRTPGIPAHPASPRRQNPALCPDLRREGLAGAAAPGEREPLARGERSPWQGDSVILEESKNIKTHQKIHYMEAGSHELLQVNSYKLKSNMMFWEVDAGKKKEV
ncbi:uncharacterized protein LOC141728143 [Zonotrichia albicollis]|uniref:uncharacterized protein LOC141728143 n=1 Tax=Zonotrichia albicollis TaxID=44394 RepID=UPI003D80D0A6